GNPVTPWHATRDRIAELAALMSLLAGVAERIAAEVARLQATELGEIAEPLQPGHIGSSTMPQKRNPHLSEALVAKARLGHGLASTLMRNGAHQHERDMGAWAVEWVAVPELMVISGAIAADLRRMLDGLEVHPERMRANLDLTGGQIAAEALMMRLDPAIGRDRAHDLLVELTRAADAADRPFSEVAASDPRVTEHLNRDEVAAALDPANYTGAAASIVDAAGR
ncbi:MAG: lyase family protein, partial [Candidatus Binatia bacterium]